MQLDAPPIPPVTPVRVRGHVLLAALAILEDGKPRDADAILAQGLARGLLPPSMTRKYVYTALIEYIARTQGRNRKPLVVQNVDRTFRINEPLDAWPAVPLPPDPPPATNCAALCVRLEQTARGDDPAAFEQAVCDTFAALGFVAVHLGGEEAPDGYVDAALGPLQYRAMLECKSAKAQVTQPDCFEASKYRQAYGADFCLLVGPAFGDDVELNSELQTHDVSAWTVADLQELLHLGASAQEMRPLFAPGFAADALADLAWERHHGQRKRLAVVCMYLQQAGWAMQQQSATQNARADAPAITQDVAVALVDDRLRTAGTQVACTRDLALAAFAYLTSPMVGAAIWTDAQQQAIIIVRPGQ